MTVALVAGCAASVWVDTAAALSLFEPDIFVVVKSVGCIWPWPIDVWVSYPKHRPAMELYVKRRELARLPAARKLVFEHPGMDLGPAAGCSGFFGLCVALTKADKAVLVGMPMDKSPHWNDPRPWNSLPYRRQWERARKHIGARTRSMSGWTRQFLGPPTPEWLNAD